MTMFNPPSMKRVSIPGLPLSALGTARLRLEPGSDVAHFGTAAGDLAPAFSQSLDLDPQDAFLAAEVAGWATHLSASERASLAAVVARLLAEVGQGSTRMAVSPTEATLLRRAPALVGAPGAATPLILLDGQLTLHRLFAAENRLAAAILIPVRPCLTTSVAFEVLIQE